jgi:hypothetical protein
MEICQLVWSFDVYSCNIVVFTEQSVPKTISRQQRTRHHRFLRIISFSIQQSMQPQEKWSRHSTYQSHISQHETEQHVKKLETKYIARVRFLN